MSSAEHVFARALPAVLLAHLSLAGCGTQVLDLPEAELVAPEIRLPNLDGSLKLAVIGDSGTGASAQYRVGAMMAAARETFPFELVLMLGDNLYGSEGPDDYDEKFAAPYAPLLDAGVRFRASLGNHDETSQIFYEPFGMNGEQYYTFTPHDDVRLFALDTNYMSPEQIEWLQQELESSESAWKIAFFHHPIYSSAGRHGSDVQLRRVLEPIFQQYGVDVVLQGHDHIYERVVPQHGIHYFVSGSAAKLRPGDLERGPLFAAGFDQGFSFMLLEIADQELYFQAISDAGETLDSGTIVNREATPDVLTTR